MSNSLLSCYNLSTGYQLKSSKTIVHEDLNLEVQSGQLIGLLGPNGAGKSTLLRTLSGLQESIKGQVFLKGDLMKDVPPRNRAKTLAVVLTSEISDQFLKVGEFLALGRYPYTGWSGYLSPSDHVILDEVIDQLNLNDFVSRNMTELSDGERQRVLIGRALAQEPSVVLLDEPTSFLDLPHKVELMHLLWELSRKRGVSFLYSTHDLELALKVCDKIMILNQDQGKGTCFMDSPEVLIQSGIIEEVFCKRGLKFDPYTASFQIQQSSKYPLYWELKSLNKLQASLTEMALSRLGFERNCEATLRLHFNGEEESYHLTQEGQMNQSCQSLGELIQILHQKSNDFTPISTKLNNG